MTSVTFHTTTLPSFQSTDKFDEVSSPELDILLRQCRAAAASFEAELMKRQVRRKSDIPGELGRLCSQLHSTAREIDVRQRLDGNAASNVDTAIEILFTTASDSRTQLYQAFLYDVLNHSGPGLVLLCAAGLGMKKVLHLKSADRVDLLAYVKDARNALDLPILRKFAEECGVPHINSPELKHMKPVHRRRANQAVGLNEAAQEGNQALGLAENVGDDQCVSVFKDSQAPRPPTYDDPVIPIPSRKRRRMDSVGASLPDDFRNAESTQMERLGKSSQPYESTPPSAESREMKHMCTNARAENMAALPEPFRTAVYNSRLWKWERGQESTGTTGCLATLFPKDDKQDVSLTIWCGYEEGYHLSNLFGLQLAISS